MNIIYVFTRILIGSTFCILGCKDLKKEGSTSPVSVDESDKPRYNLNPSDELLYDSLDSLEQASNDTLQDSRDNHK